MKKIIMVVVLFITALTYAEYPAHIQKIVSRYEKECRVLDNKYIADLEDQRSMYVRARLQNEIDIVDSLILKVVSERESVRAASVVIDGDIMVFDKGDKVWATPNAKMVWGEIPVEFKGLKMSAPFTDSSYTVTKSGIVYIVAPKNTLKACLKEGWKDTNKEVMDSGGAMEFNIMSKLSKPGCYEITHISRGVRVLAP